jgi:dihydroorotase
MKILIRNGHVIDPANNIDHISDLCIEDDRIISMGSQPEGFAPDETIDASGQWVLPGLVDLGAHLREPGQEHKGTIASETRAAASAGITHIACLPDTDPVIDSPAEVDFVLQQAEDAGYCHVEIIGALTTGLEGKALSEMAALHEAGCVGVAQGMLPLCDYGVLRQAMEYASSQGLTVFLQPQDSNLAGAGCAHEGAIASRLGLAPIPQAAETAALGAMLALVEQTGARTHFCRLSTARGVDMIRRAKVEGLPISADISAHQAFLTEMDISDFNSLCHVLPPLRSERDMQGLREGLSDGTLQVLCSDHQPHEADAKLAPFPSTQPGISGLETLLPLALKLYEQGTLSRSQTIACMTCSPADILGIEAGKLSPGTLADICILEPDHSWEFDTSAMLSKGRNSPFGGWPFTGRVVRTLLAGETVYAKT